MFKNLLTRIKWGALIAGVLLIGAGIYSCIMAHKTPYDINQLMDGEAKAGMMVEGDLWCNYGVYEESYSSRYGIKQKSSEVWYYIIPVGEYDYMGVAVNANARGAEFDRQTDQTYDWIMDETGTVAEPNPLHIKGKVVKMDNKDKEYFTKALVECGFTQSEIDQYAEFLYVSAGSFDEWLVVLLVGVVLTAVGVVLVIVTRRKG